MGHCTRLFSFFSFLYILVEARSIFWRRYCQPALTPALPRTAGYSMWQNYASRRCLWISRAPRKSPSLILPISRSLGLLWSRTQSLALQPQLARIWVVFYFPESTEHTFQLCPFHDLWQIPSFIDQEIGIAGLAGSFCPGGIVLAGSKVSFVTCEASSNGHSDDDVEGLATGSSGFLRGTSRPFFGVNRPFCVISSIVAWSNQEEESMMLKKLLMYELVKDGPCERERQKKNKQADFENNKITPSKKSLSCSKNKTLEQLIGMDKVCSTYGWKQNH